MAAEEIPVTKEIPIITLEKPPKVEKVPFRREPYKLPEGGKNWLWDIIKPVRDPIHADGERAREEWRNYEATWEAEGYIQDLPVYYQNQLKRMAYKPTTIGGRLEWYFWMISNTIVSIFLFPIGMTFFLLEEASQAMGMGLWIAYQSKKYKACKSLLEVYVRFIDTSTMLLDKMGWLCPWMALGTRLYFLAADEQAKIFAEVMTEATSTDIGFKEEYFKGMPAKVSVSSTPTHTKIYIDDRYTRKSTPETFYDLVPQKEYNIRVEYEEAELGLIISNTQIVSALEGEELHVPFDIKAQITAAKLEKILAPPSLTINSTPDGASIILDGIDTGMVTDATIEDIDAGEHHIRLEYYDRETKKTAVVETTIKLEAWERRTERFDMTWAIRGL